MKFFCDSAPQYRFARSSCTLLRKTHASLHQLKIISGVLLPKSKGIYWILFPAIWRQLYWERAPEKQDSKVIANERRISYIYRIDVEERCWVFCVQRMCKLTVQLWQRKISVINLHCHFPRTVLNWSGHSSFHASSKALLMTICPRSLWTSTCFFLLLFVWSHTYETRLPFWFPVVLGFQPVFSGMLLGPKKALRKSYRQEQKDVSATLCEFLFIESFAT